MELMHITTQLKNHAEAVTLCGIHFITDHADTNRVKSAGSWVSCPLCEAANILDRPALLNKPKEQQGKNRKSTGWIQPELFS